MTEHITVSRELLHRAIEALRWLLPDTKDDNHDGHDARDVRQWRQTESALRAALEQPAVEPVNFDQIATDRYKVVEAHGSLFHRWAVVAGNGTQQLYLGRELECQNMARKFAGAFLDGAWLASQHTAPQAQHPAPAPLLSDDEIHGIYDEVARSEPYSGAVTRRNVARAIEQLVRRKVGL